MDSAEHVASELGSVRVRLDGQEHTLFHGDLVGRLWSAALRIDDPRVSEAHAMVSVRGQDLKLLALRGRFQVDGKPSSDAVLVAGSVITLAPGLTFTVVDVQAPESVLRLEADGLGSRAVPGVVSLYGGVQPRIRPGWRPDADGYVWPTGSGWRRSGPEPISIDGEQSWVLAGTTFRARIDTTVGVEPTRPALRAPLTIVCRYDSVHVQRGNSTVLALSGRSAQLLSELAVLGQPCSWETLAAELWGPIDRDNLRRRWDMQLQRLRRKLRAASVRTDLVHATGHGLVELLLGPDDAVVDET